MDKKIYKKGAPIPALFIFIITAAAFLIYPGIFSKGASEGVKVCASVIIPSLFPFTVASIFIHKSGGIMWIGKKLDRFSRAVFGINGAEFTVVIISLIGGYPIGAKIADSMYRNSEISKDSAEKLILFSVNASPAFFVSTVGINLLGSQRAGIILFISNLIATLLLTAVNNRKSAKLKIEKHTKTDYYSLGDSLVLSVSEAAQVFINISAWIILFSSLSELIRLAELNMKTKVFIYSFLEVTVGCINAATTGIPLYLYSFIFGFGGLSTICQVCTAAGNVRLSFLKIFICRIVHAVTASIISYILFKAFPISQQTLNNSVNVIFSGFELSAAPVFLILTAILYFIYLKG